MVVFAVKLCYSETNLTRKEIFVYDETMEYQRTAQEQTRYRDKNNGEDYNLNRIYRVQQGKLTEKNAHIGYIMRISHNKQLKEFYFDNVQEFMAFMAKRKVILNINSAYAVLKPEFTWKYSSAFAADFGLEIPCEEILTALPKGAG